MAFDKDKKIGECDYEIIETGWNIYHTEVDSEYTGKGIAKRLVYKVLEAADKNSVKVDATCSFARKMIVE